MMIAHSFSNQTGNIDAMQIIFMNLSDISFMLVREIPNLHSVPCEKNAMNSQFRLIKSSIQFRNGNMTYGVIH